MAVILHILGAILSGFVLIRAMWIDDYLTIVVMLIAFGSNVFLMWEAFKGRQ